MNLVLVLFCRKQSQRAWGFLSLNMSFDELCLIISFIEYGSLWALGNTFVKMLSQWVKEMNQRERGGCVKQVGGRHFEVLYFVQFLPSGQTFLEVWGFRPLSLIVETEITSDDSSEPGVRVNDGGIIRWLLKWPPRWPNVIQIEHLELSEYCRWLLTSFQSPGTSVFQSLWGRNG